MANITPPFTWIVRHASWFTLTVLAATAAFFRFFQLTTLPPGLYTGEANIGLQAQRLAQHGQLPVLDSANGFAPLWIWLEALSVKAFGHTALALRLWPALLGVAAVYFTWLWVKDWFGPRIGWLAAFVVAVTPWSVTLTRNAMPTALILCLVPLTLWTATWAYHRNTAKWWLIAASILVLDLLAGPLGWLLAATVLALGIVRQIQRRELRLNRPRLLGLGVLAIGFGLAGYLAGTSVGAIKALPATLGLTASPAAFLDNLTRTLLMFNIRGDENFRHNFASQPLLNAFLGLMLITGILVAVSRTQQRRYRIVLLLLVIFLLPALTSTVGSPNAAHAVLALPVVAILAAIGISYMLELWYSTFPINSAARSTGQAVIIVLLSLTLLQGYAQYFRAWAASSETYAAYNEPAVAVAKFLSTNKFTGERYVVATPDELPILAYLTDGKPDYHPLQPKDLIGLPISAGTRQFAITAAARNEAAKNLSLKFPGGKLRPYASTFSQNEIYYVYEVTK